LPSNYDLKPLSLADVKTYPLASRPSKVTVKQFARPCNDYPALRDFLSNLPDILAVQSLRQLAAQIRKARDAVKIPDNYTAPRTTLTVSPDDVEEAFVKSNPGLSRAAVSVTCGSTRLSEVRICMSKDLKFRDCDEIDRRACRRDKLIMPPVRGGA